MKFLIDMNERQETALRQIAVKWGFILDRSQRQGEGNVAALLRAVADGKMAIYPVAPDWKNGNSND